MLLRLVGFGDLAAYYLFISLVYATTAYAVYLVATLYVGRTPAAASSGLMDLRPAPWPKIPAAGGIGLVEISATW